MNYGVEKVTVTRQRRKTCNQFSWLQIYAPHICVNFFLSFEIFSACWAVNTVRHETTHGICLYFPAHFVAFHMETFTKCISEHESQLSCLIKSTAVFFCALCCSLMWFFIMWHFVDVILLHYTIGVGWIFLLNKPFSISKNFEFIHSHMEHETWNPNV